MRGLEPVVRAYVAWAVERRGRIDVGTVEAIWPIAVGRVWAERARPLALRGARLEVGVPDGVWLAELRYQREQVLARLNELLPDGVPPIRSLRLVVADASEWTPPPRAAIDPPSTPLTEEQASALEAIADPELRALMRRVVTHDIGRLQTDEPADSDET